MHLSFFRIKNLIESNLFDSFAKFPRGNSTIDCVSRNYTSDNGSGGNDGALLNVRSGKDN
jgi:hypothetical protein